jgi:hypothetical protein
MFVRTRPKDRIRAVVTKQTANQIDQEWNVAGGIRDPFSGKEEEFEKERTALTKKYSKQYSIDDVKWSHFNRQLINHIKERNWGLHSSTRYEMAEHLRGSMDLKRALETYLEVCYLDINGPMNLGAPGKHGIDMPPYDPELGSIPPAVVDHIQRISAYLKLQKPQVRKIFLDHNADIAKRMRLPLTPEVCWLKLEKEIDR